MNTLAANIRKALEVLEDATNIPAAEIAELIGLLDEPADLDLP